MLNKAYQNNRTYYARILGAGSKTQDTLWGKRDKIAHANYIVEVTEYSSYKDAAVWMCNELVGNMPESYDKAHNAYLAHKKKVISLA